MATTYRRWPTEAEARAFAAGVEYANDSALTIQDIYRDAHPAAPWVVLMEDQDDHADDDPGRDMA